MHRKQWIFDMDGTLTDSMTVVWQGAPLELLRRYGRTARPGIHDVLLSMGMVEGAGISHPHLRSAPDPPGLRACHAAGHPGPVQKVELKPGVREMLARLKAEGVRMCICSNTWAEQCEEVLTRLGVADYFEFFYTAQGAKSKAHPEVFHEVLERLGGSEPADAVVCEDAVYATRTAKQCGFYLIDIEDETSAADQPELQRLADQYITDWTQLDWTKSWNYSKGEALPGLPIAFIGTAFPDNLSALSSCRLPPAGTGTRAPLCIQNSPAASWDTAARLTT